MSNRDRRALAALAGKSNAGHDHLGDDLRPASLTHSGPELSFFGVDPAARQPAITEPSGGTVQDVEVREVIGDILATLRAYGLIEEL